MAIPVAVPGSPLSVSNDDNTNAETLLTAFVQLIARGTTGASITTPPVLVPASTNPTSTTPILMDTAEKQLFTRHMCLVMAKLVVLRSELEDHRYNVTPSGLVDGSNINFFVASYKSESTRVYVDGLRRTLNVDYTERGSGELRFDVAPEPGSVIIVDYIKV